MTTTTYKKLVTQVVLEALQKHVNQWFFLENIVNETTDKLELLQSLQYESKKRIFGEVLGKRGLNLPQRRAKGGTRNMYYFSKIEHDQREFNPNLHGAKGLG